MKYLNNFGKCHSEENNLKYKKLIFCYYLLPQMTFHTKILDIPTECDRVVIEGAYLLNNTLKLAANFGKFINILKEQNITTIGSIKCEGDQNSVC